MATTTGMKGNGFYDSHSNEQRAALDVFLPWLEEEMAKLPLPDKASPPLAFLDIGSSEGGNALYAMTRLLAALRCHTNAPIWMFFNDLPTNDFNHLFSNLFLKGRNSLDAENVFPAAISGTGFGRLVPPCSLSVATSFNAIGFLERIPEGASLPNYILPMPPNAPRSGVSVSDSEHAPFRVQAATDLRVFYQARADELVSGGRLLLQVFGRNEDISTAHGIYDVLSDALLDAVEAGELPAEVYEKLIFPVYFRTLEELLSPLKDNPQLAKDFRIEKAEVREVPAPFNQLLAQTGDLDTWAAEYMGFLRAFTEPILMPAIPAGIDATAVVAGIYERVVKRLLSDPERYEFHYVSLAVLAVRE